MLHQLKKFITPDDYLAEIEQIIVAMQPDFDFSALRKTHWDVVRLFCGTYPGFRSSNTKYHNLDHTNAVTLATTRLLHGLHLHGRSFSQKDIDLAVCAALFHDTGLIQKETDTQGTGAKYTEGHEERSIHFMQHYLLDVVHFSNSDVALCKNIIQCTILSLSPATIQFGSESGKVLGMVVGSADLLAQMADRFYLEKLPCLFQEFEEGGISGYNSEMELVVKTEEFYHEVVKKRLLVDLENVKENVHLHFKERWGVDRDLYSESINNNLSHLNKLRHECKGDFQCLMNKLRRKYEEGGVCSSFPVE